MVVNQQCRLKTMKLSQGLGSKLATEHYAHHPVNMQTAFLWFSFQTWLHLHKSNQNTVRNTNTFLLGKSWSTRRDWFQCISLVGFSWVVFYERVNDLLLCKIRIFQHLNIKQRFTRFLIFHLAWHVPICIFPPSLRIGWLMIHIQSLEIKWSPTNNIL